MDTLRRFERAAAAARHDRAPAIDVVDQVMVELERRSWPTQRRTDGNLALATCAALSVLAASVMAAVALDAWWSMSDPMGTLIESFATVIQ